MVVTDKYRCCANCQHEGDRGLLICGKGIVRTCMREGGRHCIDHDFRPGWEHDGTLFEGLCEDTGGSERGSVSK